MNRCLSHYRDIEKRLKIDVRFCGSIEIQAIELNEFISIRGSSALRVEVDVCCGK